MTKPLTVQQFFAQFPTDDACLDHLFRTRFGEQVQCPKCNRISKFLPAGLRVGLQLPVVRPPLAPDGRYPVRKDPHLTAALVLRHVSVLDDPHGVSAKELQREFGCSYKTAWRMGHEIRKYLGVLAARPAGRQRRGG